MTKDLVKLGLALLLGAAIAFPAGMMMAGSRDGSESRPAPRRDTAAVRDAYSPAIRSDPWFLERQREGVEALERHCMETGESCPVARAARRRLTELEAGD